MSLAEPIPYAAHVRERRSARRVELGAKAREVCLQPLGIGIALLRPTCTQERAPLQHLTRSCDESGEQAELGRGPLERVTLDARDVGLRLHAEAADGGRRPLR